MSSAGPLTYPTRHEIHRAIDRAADAGDEYHRTIRRFWWSTHPGEAITGPPRERFNRAREAERAWAELRRELYPEPYEIQARADAAVAFAVLAEAGINPAAWEYSGRYQPGPGRPFFYEYLHRGRREADHRGPRFMHLPAPTCYDGSPCEPFDCQEQRCDRIPTE